MVTRIEGPDPAPTGISVLVVEDNRLLREGIVAILERHEDLRVVGVAEDAESALSQSRTCGARVVLLDSGLGDEDDYDLLEELVEAMPDAGIIVMDVLPENGDISEFVRRGATGFLVKETSVDLLVEAVRAVASGTSVLPRSLTNTLFADVARQALARSEPAEHGDTRMTPREQEVIGLIARGLSNKAIARQLSISTHTVKSHVRNILEKLSLHSRLQVAAYYHQAEASED